MSGICSFSGCTPSGPKALLQGEELLQKGQTKEAVKKMERAVKYMPNNARALNYLGVALHRDGQLKEALQAYQRALNLTPSLNVLKYNLGCLYLDQRNYQIAIQSFSNYLNFNQNYAPAWEKIGYAFLATHQNNLAAISLSNVVRINPQDAKTLNTLGLLATTDQNITGALNLFAQSAQCNPDYAAPHLNMAVLLQNAGSEKHRESAIQSYNRYLTLAPKAKNADNVRSQVAALTALSNPSKAQPAVALASAPAVPSTPQKAPKATVAQKVPSAVPETNLVAVAAPVQTNLQNQLPQTNQLAQVTPAPAVAQTNKSENVVVTSLLPRNPEPKTEPEKSEPVTPAPQVAKAAETPKALPTVSDVPEVVDVTAREAEKTELPPAQNEKAATAPANPAPSQPVETQNQEPSVISIIPTVQDELEAQPDQELTEEDQEPQEVTPASSPSKEETPARIVQITPTETSGEEANKGNFFSRIFGGKKRSTDSEPSATETKGKTLPTPKSEPPTISIVPVDSASKASSPGNNSSALPAELRVYEPYIYKNPPVPAAGNRDEAYPLFQRAFRAHQERDLPTAIEFYSKAIQKDPAWFEANFNLGLAYYGAGEYSSAVLAYENALAINPNSWETRYSFAQALNKAEHPNEAVLELKKVTELNDSYANAWLELGMIYQNKFSDIPNAYKAYQKFVTLAPEHHNAYAAKVWLSQNADRAQKN